MIDDALGALALKFVDRIYQRNLAIIRTNFKILNDFIENEPLLDWIPPKAGSVGFMKLNLDMPTEQYCLQLIKEKSTFLVPGTCFEQEGFLRIGFGNNTEVLKKGLGRMKKFLDTLRK